MPKPRSPGNRYALLDVLQMVAAGEEPPSDGVHDFGLRLEQAHKAGYIGRPLVHWSSQSAEPHIDLARALHGLTAAGQDFVAGQSGAVATERQMTENTAKEARTVFVVHGRDAEANDAVFAFLRAMDLKPLSFDDLIKATGKGTPFVLEAVQAGFARAQAAVVLLTPDEHAQLRQELGSARECEPGLQPRPNVWLEMGMALALHPDRTVVVRIGEVRAASDVGGKHIPELIESTESRKTFAQRIRTVCPAADYESLEFLRTIPFPSRATVATSSERSARAIPSPAESRLTHAQHAVVHALGRVAQFDNTPWLSTPEVARQAGLQKMEAELALEELYEREVVTNIIDPGSGFRWQLTSAGRRIAIELHRLSPTITESWEVYRDPLPSGTSASSNARSPRVLPDNPKTRFWQALRNEGVTARTLQGRIDAGAWRNSENNSWAIELQSILAEEELTRGR